MKTHNTTEYEMYYIPTRREKWLAHIQRNFILYRRISTTLDILGGAFLIAIVLYFILHY